MSRITSLPATTASQRVSQANSYKELIDLIPVNVRPPMAMLCEELYRLSQKAATIGAAVDELTHHKESKSLPRTIAVSAPKLQTTKEFAGSGVTRQLQKQVEEFAAAYAAQIRDTTLQLKTQELEFLKGRLDQSTWGGRVTAIAADLVKRLGKPDAPTPSSTPSGQSRAQDFTFLESGWEASLPIFAYRAIALGDATVQRDLAIKMRKMSLQKETRQAAKEDAMDVDKPAPALTSATISDIVDKRLQEALKKMEGMMSRASKGAIQSKPPPKRAFSDIETDSVTPRKKSKKEPFREGLSPQAEPTRLSPREGQREEFCGAQDGAKKVWEEVRECLRQTRNLSLARNPLRIPDMYLDMSEQARLIFETLHIRPNELLGISRSEVFISPNAYVPSDVETFLSLNGKFVLHTKEPLDDTDLLLSWSQVETTALWAFFFKNANKKPFDARLHVSSDALIPEGIHPHVQEGLDAGAQELLSQAAHARSLWSDRANPSVAPVRSYLKNNQLIVKPTDKNLGLAVLTLNEYESALEQHIRDGPYELAELPVSAQTFHLSLLERLPKKGLSKEEERFIRQHRDVHWPKFHVIPKVHKSPWGVRPIVPAHSSPTARMSKVADIALAQLLPRFPHLIRSTAEWIRAYEDGLTRHTGGKLWLVTGDVVAFYTNIDIANIGRSMEALMRGSKWSAQRSAAIAYLVHAVTHKNYFSVNDQLFRQTDGLAMGSPCSGTVANLSMARREKRFLGRQGILAYTRYIDDVFMLLEARNVTEVRHILNEVTEAIAPLRINWNVSERHAVYLDVQVSFDWFTGASAYKPFRKPGNQLAMLPWSSAHPEHVKKGIVIGETTRLSLLCSEELTFRQEVASFKENLMRRGYPLKALSAWTRRVPWNRRFETLRATGQPVQASPGPLRLPTIYNPIWEHIDLHAVFEKVLKYWGPIWEAETRPSHMSLSQSRGSNLLDLLSSWNRQVITGSSSEDLDVHNELALLGRY